MLWFNYGLQKYIVNTKIQKMRKKFQEASEIQMQTRMHESSKTKVASSDLWSVEKVFGKVPVLSLYKALKGFSPKCAVFDTASLF